MENVGELGDMSHRRRQYYLNQESLKKKTILQHRGLQMFKMESMLMEGGGGGGGGMMLCSCVIM